MVTLTPPSPQSSCNIDHQALLPASWPPVFSRQLGCVKGYGMAVDVARGLVVVSGWWNGPSEYLSKLVVYSLADGSLVRCLGGYGSDEGRFNWGAGGLCMTPTGNVLVAEFFNNRLQEVRVDDGGWVRFLGRGFLSEPNYVACSQSAVAVSESNQHRVTVLSWPDGSLLRRLGTRGDGDGQLCYPHGLRLLARGGVVVADHDNGRLCVFSMAGEFVTAHALPAGAEPFDVVECDGGGSFIVCDGGGQTLCKIGAAGAGDVAAFGGQGADGGQFKGPAAIALTPRSGGDGAGADLVVLDAGNSRLQVFRC